VADGLRHNNDPSYSWVPASFRKGARRGWHQRRRHAAVLRLLKGLNGEVLDYGCGYGDVSYAVSATHAVRGVDVDPVRVAFAAQEYAPIPFQVCDKHTVPFPEATFDVVLSSVVIQFVEDPVAYLEEVKRVLRPGGYLLLICRQRPLIRLALRRALGRGPVSELTWVGPDGQSQQVWLPAIPEFEDFVTQQGFQALRKDHFYDPPLTSTAWRDLLFQIPEQFLSLLGVRSTATYFGLLLRKKDRDGADEL
jgi:ubiquinone/menaquinone biosynthesis C-methylase UbiE